MIPTYLGSALATQQSVAAAKAAVDEARRRYDDARTWGHSGALERQDVARAESRLNLARDLAREEADYRAEGGE